MFTINIKGKENPRNPELIKLEMVLFKTNYARVTKVLNITGLIKDWDVQTQRFKSKRVEAAEKNKRLLDIKTQYLKVAEEWESEDRQWTPVQWSHCFATELKKKNEVKVLSVCQTFKIIIEEMSGKERIKNGKVITSYGNAVNYHDLEMTFSAFVKQKYDRSLSSYYFNEITETFARDYALFIQKRAIERGNAGALSHRLKRFYGLLYYATKLNIPDVDMSILEGIRPLMKTKPTKPKTLPHNVMCKIENIDRSLFTLGEQLCLDLFLFSYYTGGMAPVDVCYLTWDCVDDNGYLDYERIKFPKRAKMKFTTKAKAIVEKYKDQSFENYMLPIFDHKHPTEKQRRWRMLKVGRNVNKTLAKVEKIVKYNDRITWYAARGTFISKMIASLLLPPTVAEMSGNSPNTIYNHYFMNTDQKLIDATMEAAL